MIEVQVDQPSDPKKIKAISIDFLHTIDFFLHVFSLFPNFKLK